MHPCLKWERGREWDSERERERERPFDHSPIKKCKGFSSYFFTTVPIKNLLPNRSGAIKVPYFAMPISYGLNSTQSKSILEKKDISLIGKWYRDTHN